MRFLAVLTILALFAGETQAQIETLSKKEQRKLIREEKKKEAEEHAARMLELTENMVKSSRFVLEADMLSNRFGQTVNVPSSINFLMVDSLYGIIQVGNSYSLGANGVGGTTIEGKIRNYEVEKNKKGKTFNVNYDLYSNMGGTYTVRLSTYGIGKAEATVSGSFSNGNIKYSGNLVPLEASRVFKGSAY